MPPKHKKKEAVDKPVGPPGGPVTVHQAAPESPKGTPDDTASPAKPAAVPKVESKEAAKAVPAAAATESKASRVKWDPKSVVGKSMEELRAMFNANLALTEGVQIEVSPQYSAVPAGVYHEMPLLVTITGGKLPQAYARPALNLCIVLDRSGSMAETIEHCKQAISNIVSNLSENDLVHLVVYDDTVDVVFTNMRSSQSKKMLAQVAEVKARGGTDIKSGLEGGIAVLMGSEALGTKAVFLFSDGMATTGEKDGQQIGVAAQKLCSGAGISISTFGIGNSYDEKLLKTIANLGNGYYYYIENPERIPHVVQQGLNGLGNFWSQDAELFIQGKGTTLVKEVSGFSSVLFPKKFKIRELGFIQHLVRAVHSGDGQPEIVAHFRYTDFAGRKSENKVTATWRLLANPFEMKTEEHPDVQCHMRMLQCSELNKEITEMIAAHKPEQEVKAKKAKIVELYEALLPSDRFCILPALLAREKETLGEFNSKGVYTEAAAKKQSYYAAKSAGYQEASYDVGAPEQEDEACDLGFGLFD